jgi:hypothetical protein
MPLSPKEAAAALGDIERTGRHTTELQVYAGASPFFLVWGAVWVFGYTMTHYMPEFRNLFWVTSIFLGTVVSIVLGRPMSKGQAGGRSFSSWRYAAISGGIAGFFALTSIVLKLDTREIDAFVPLMFAGIYLAVSQFAGIRFAVCGAILAIATAIGFYNAGDSFGLWMAVAGGGVLLLTGLWLRRV